MKIKRSYERLCFLPLSIIPERQVLAASIVKNALISSAGQELGPEYDFAQETDINTDKTFSNEWETGM